MIDEIKLVLATENDAKIIRHMQYEAVLLLYEKYHDDETSPVKESMDTVVKKIRNDKSDYYKIQWTGTDVGAVRVVRKIRDVDAAKEILYISPLFILPKYQNQGIGYIALQKVFEIYSPVTAWKLTTIKQEAANCHLYEKCGFVRVGEEYLVNECMTLVDYEYNRDKNKL